MSEAKRPKNENQDPDSSSDEEEMEEDFTLKPVGSEEIQVELIGYPLHDKDFNGIHQFLLQLFTDDCTINLEQLTNSLIEQNFIGTIMKTEEDEIMEEDENDEPDLYALLTCYSLTRPKNSVRDSLIKYLLDKCNSSKGNSSTKETFKKILLECVKEGSSEPVGLVINERFINTPAQCSPPMFNSLLEEISQAQTRQHKSRFDFAYYIMICKTCNFTVQNSSQTFFANSEEEFFSDKAISSFKFSVTNNSEMSQRLVLLLNKDGFQAGVRKLLSG